MSELIEKVLEEEGFTDWTIKWCKNNPLVQLKSKEIIISKEDGNYMPMVLHEVAHIKVGESCCDRSGHDGHFTDVFTELVGKYMVKNNGYSK